MEYQYHNILEPGPFKETNLNPENSNNIIIGILIVATVIAASYYIYHKYIYKKRVIDSSTVNN
jgi:hypothetical protein